MLIAGRKDDQIPVCYVALRTPVPPSMDEARAPPDANRVPVSVVAGAYEVGGGLKSDLILLLA